MIGCLNNRFQNLRKLAKLRAIKLAEQYAKNTTTTSIPPSNNNMSTRASSITNNINSQRGRSIGLNAATQAKPSPIVNPPKPNPYQVNSSFTTKKPSI